MTDIISLDERRNEKAMALMREISEAGNDFMEGNLYNLPATIIALEQKYGMLADEAGRLILERLSLSKSLSSQPQKGE